MCKIIICNLSPPPIGALFVIPAPRPTYIYTCITEFGYVNKTESLTLCAKCYYRKPLRERKTYNFNVRHYIQICTEDIIPRCETCNEILAVSRLLAECTHCTLSYPVFQRHIQEQGNTIEDLGEFTRVHLDLRRRLPDTIPSRRTAAFSASLINSTGHRNQ